MDDVCGGSNPPPRSPKHLTKYMENDKNTSENRRNEIRIYFGESGEITGLQAAIRAIVDKSDFRNIIVVKDRFVVEDGCREMRPTETVGMPNLENIRVESTTGASERVECVLDEEAETHEKFDDQKEIPGDKDCTPYFKTQKKSFIEWDHVTLAEMAKSLVVQLKQSNDYIEGLKKDNSMVVKYIKAKLKRERNAIKEFAANWEAHNKMLSEKLDKATQRVAELEHNQYGSFKDSEENILEALTEMIQENKKLKAEYNDLSNEYSQLEETNKRLNQVYRELETIHEKLQFNYNKVVTVCANRQKNIDDLEELNERLCRQVEKYAARHTELKNNLERLELINGNYSKGAVWQENRIKELEAKLAKIKSI
jgi:DNA repair exonuclease SbcCD ATPase subunit